MLKRLDPADLQDIQGYKAPDWFSRLRRKLRTRARKIVHSRIVTIDDIKLEVDRRRFPAKVVRSLYGERYEDMEAKLVCRSLRRGDRVLEMGAGIGFISMLCARICGADAVLSYEANPENEPYIKRNYALNNLFPQFRNRAVSVSKGEMPLFLDPNFLSTGFINRGYGKKTTVACDAISDVIREFRPNCIVMDVEGAEIDLLPAAPLEGINKIILETHARVVGQAAVNDLDGYLRAQGFLRTNPDGGKVCLYLRYPI